MGAASILRIATWAALRPATQRMKRHVLNGIESTLGESTLRNWKRGDVAAGRDKRAATPAAAENFVKSLRSFFAWALETGLVSSNRPMASRSSRRQREASRLGPTMTLRPTAPAGRSEPDSVSCSRFYGRPALRRGDAVRVGLPHVRDRVIRLATEKTGERVSLPVSDVLAAAIEAGPVGKMTFIASAAGKPMTKESFGTIFREWCDAAGVSKSAHGIRKAAATADAQNGYSDTELDAKFGWTGRKMAAHYTRTVNRERLSIAAAARVKSRT